MHSSAGHSKSIYHYTLPCVKVSCTVVLTTYDRFHKSVKHCKDVKHATVIDTIVINKFQRL